MAAARSGLSKAAVPSPLPTTAPPAAPAPPEPPPAPPAPGPVQAPAPQVYQPPANPDPAPFVAQPRRPVKREQITIRIRAEHHAAVEAIRARRGITKQDVLDEALAAWIVHYS
jgi:hypothetical protein